MAAPQLAEQRRAEQLAGLRGLEPPSGRWPLRNRSGGQAVAPEPRQASRAAAARGRAIREPGRVSTTWARRRPEAERPAEAEQRPEAWRPLGPERFRRPRPRRARWPRRGLRSPARYPLPEPVGPYGEAGRSRRHGRARRWPAGSRQSTPSGRTRRVREAGNIRPCRVQTIQIRPRQRGLAGHPPATHRVVSRVTRLSVRRSSLAGRQTPLSAPAPGGQLGRYQSWKGFCTRMVSSRSGLVESSDTGAPTSSSM